MNTPIRFALMSYGKVASLHARALKATRGAELVAVWGRDKAKREAFAAEFDIQPYNDVHRMVSESSVDVVIIASPHPLHREHSLMALDAGAHVLVEKPMALSTSDCDAMIRAAKEAKKKLGVISQRRWYPSARRIKEAIDAGKIGDPVLGQIIMLGYGTKNITRAIPGVAAGL
ncbi:hypothetical protein MASR2M78_11320 [Treponema sp.]